MPVDDQISSARGALQLLEQATERLVRHYGDSVDVRRLRLDVGRVRDDVDLLCGLPAPRAPQPQVQPIDDVPYAADLWADAEDEGVGPSRY